MKVRRANLAVALLVLAGTAEASQPPCRFDDPQVLSLVRTIFLLPVSQGDIDTVPSERFAAVLLPKKAENYTCFSAIFHDGPASIPGFAEEYRAGLDNLPSQARAFIEAHGPSGGYGILPALIFLEPRKGRELAESEIRRKNLRPGDVAFLAGEIWPRRSRVVRDRLRSELKRPIANTQLKQDLLSHLIRFARKVDFAYVESRLTELPTEARLVRLYALRSRQGRTKELLAVVSSGDRAKMFPAAIDALVSSGHMKLLCSLLRSGPTPDVTDAVMGIYDAAKRGSRWEQYPDDVIARIQEAPQVWLCGPPEVPIPDRFGPNTPRQGVAATWKRPPLGGDSP